MAAKFEIKKGSSGQFRFNLKAPNGKVILTSETYPDIRTAKQGIESVRKNASKDSAFDLLTSKRGEPYFTLKAGNGEIIGKSEMYSSTGARDKGVEAVKTHAADASVSGNSE